MRPIIATVLVALAAVAGIGTAAAQTYDPDTVVLEVSTPEGRFEVTYEQARYMFTALTDEIRQAGGCEPYVTAGLRDEEATLPLGPAPLVAACKAALAGS